MKPKTHIQRGRSTTTYCGRVIYGTMFEPVTWLSGSMTTKDRVVGLPEATCLTCLRVWSTLAGREMVS